MSTEARIILTAQDRTAQAFRSAQAQLAQMNVAVGKVNSALGALGVGVSIGAVTAELVQSARAAINFGDEMQKASARTGVSASRFAVLADAAKMADVDVSALSTAFKKMQVAVSQAGSGAKAPLETFKALGIQFDEFRRLDPEGQFLALADGISKLQDPADRTRAAVELFGRAGADLLPFFEQGAAGIRQATDEIRAMGGALTDDQIRKLADADDAIKRLDRSWNTLARTLTAAVAPALVNVFDRTAKVIDQRGDLETLATAWLKISAATISPAAMGSAVGGLFRAPASRVAPLGSDARTRALSRGGGSGVLAVFEAAPGYQPNPPKGRTKTAAELAGLSEIAITARQISTSAYQQMLEDMNNATKTSLEKQVDQFYAARAQLDQVFAEGMISPETFNARVEEINSQFLEPITITAEKIFPPEEQQQFSEFWVQASRNTQDILANWLYDPFEEGIQGMLKAFGDMLLQMAAQAVAADITSKIFGSNMGGGGGLLGSFMSMLGGTGGSGGDQLMASLYQTGSMPVIKPPGYAKGGYIKPGSLGWTGENGPELIYGGKSGVTVTPVQAGGGMSVTNHFVIEAPGGTVSRQTQQQVAAAAARGIAAASRRNG